LPKQFKIKNAQGELVPKYSIDKWVSDGGGEYISKELSSWMSRQGADMVMSTPYQPQQNGQAKRFNHTINDKADAMQFQACIPDSWWEFAVLHAV
jgi:transposase InsO family protein